MAEIANPQLIDQATGNQFALPGLIDFGPEPGSATEIIQNVFTLLRTAIWSVPLDRLIGIDYRFVDLPSPDPVRLHIQAELFQKINFYEPRVVAQNIDWQGEPLVGYLEPTVTLEFNPAALSPDRQHRRLLELTR
jgi:phage baseplate assembly protein W